MSKIILTDSASAPPNVEIPDGTHALYTTAAGVFVKDNTGTVVGPFSTGGGGTPSGSILEGDLAGSSYPSPFIASLAVGESKLADGAVTSLKIAAETIAKANMAADSVDSLQLVAGSVTSGKLAMTPAAYQFVLADGPGTSWVSGLPTRIKFDSPARISILGDTGVDPSPLNPQVKNSLSGDADLGYLTRTQRNLDTGDGGVSTITLPNGFSYYEFSLSAAHQNYYLPDCQMYPPGSEIIVINGSSALWNVVIVWDADGDTNRAISGPSGVIANQTISSDYAGRRYITNGQAGGGWISIGSF